MKKYNRLILVLVIVVLSIIAVILLLQRPSNMQPFTTRELVNLTDNDKVVFDFNGNKLDLAIAKSEEKRELGYMNQENIPNNTGILFIFEDSAPRIFWMQNTPSSLDIIFLNEDLRVINFYNSTKPNQTIELYSSSKPAKYVIETREGWTKSMLLDVNSTFTIYNIVQSNLTSTSYMTKY